MSDQQQEQTAEQPAVTGEPVADQQTDERDGGQVANEEINVGSQGEQVPTDAVGVDQSRAVAQSPPPPEAQSGVPLSADREAGVEAQPQFAGPVGTGEAATERGGEAVAQGATEQNTTHPASPSE